MRKKMMTFLVFLLVCVTAGAEDVTERPKEKDITVRGGIKVEALMLNFIQKYAGNSVSVPDFGGSIGGYMDVRFTDLIELHPELNLNHQRTVFSWDDKSGNFRGLGVEIPIYVVAGWDVFDNDRLRIGVGPFTEFMYFADWKIDGRTVKLLDMNEEGEPMIRDTQSGFGAAFSYEFGIGLRINVSYRISITDMLQPNISQGVKLYPQTFGVGLAYTFKGRKNEK